jgi:class 3 adenylate cyclase
MSTRRLAAILAADVAGYSRLMGADEEGTLQRLKAIRAGLIDPTLAAHNGRRQDHWRWLARRVRQCGGCLALRRRGAARDG